MMRQVFLILLGLFLLVGCQTNNAEVQVDPTAIPVSPTADRVYAAPQSNSGFITSGADTRYQPEAQALIELANFEGQELTVQPASAEDIAWLSGTGVPQSVLDFYGAAEPQQDVESNGVFLRPLRAMQDTNQNTSLGVALNPHGYVIIATTVGGDSYYIDTNNPDSSGEAPIYIVNHELVLSDASLETIQANSRLMAVSFPQFLTRFIQSILPYDYAQEEQLVSASAQRAFFTRYEDSRFEILYPTSWFRTIDPANPDQVYFVRNSSQLTNLGSVASVAVRDGRGSLEEIAASIVRTVEEDPDVTLVQVEEPIRVNVNGVAGIEQQFEYLVGTTTLVQRMVLLQDQERTYVITLSLTVEQMDPLFGIFDNMLDSFVVSG